MNELSIFLAALDVSDPIERSEFLIKVCAGDTTLMRKVKALLASHEKAGDFLDVPALGQMSDTPAVTEVARSIGSENIDLSYLASSMRPDTLGTLGNYEILQVLGQGGFGTVLKAWDEKLQRHVAIKVLRRELAATSPPRKRFLREARSVAAIKNENVVAIYSVEEQPIPYFVMEFVEGVTLQEKMDESGPLPVSEILHLGHQIASGLAAAHAAGLIHRDIKPANILLEVGVVPKVKITDFGLARAADDASITQSGMIVGTPLYMAPEQAKGASLDARTDLFSLGSVLYALAAGHPPFRAPSALAVLRRVTEDPPRPMQDVIADIPDWLVTIVNKLLAKEPNDRFQSAQELADVLAKCQGELRAGVPSIVFKEPGAKRLKPIAPVAGVLAGILLTFTVMAASLYLLNRSNHRSTADVVAPTASNVPSSSTTIVRSDRSVAEPKNTKPGVVRDNKANPAGPLPATFINSIGMEFVKVPSGTAWLGGGSGKPGNVKVEIERDFYLGKYEVTQEEWERVMGLTPSYFSRTGPGAEAVKDISDADLRRFPVELVSWEDSKLFIERLNEREKGTGRVYRLPTTTEWEYACRGGPGDQLTSAFDFYFFKPTNHLRPDQANFEAEKPLKRTTKVGSYEPNLLGLHDMHGNVWEWCDGQDQNVGEASSRVRLGGGWCHTSPFCRPTFRNSYDPTNRFYDDGLRLVMRPFEADSSAELRQVE